MGRGRSKAGGNSSTPQATARTTQVSQPTPQVTPPTKPQIAQGNTLPKGGVPFADFEKMTDDQKADVVEAALNTGVPLFLDKSGLQRFAYFTGMNEKPTVVADSSFDALKGTELYRTVYDGYNKSTDIGYTSKDIYNQICKGDFTMYSDSGGSAHGKGIYFADSYRDSISYGYGAKNPIVMRAKINSSAKIISENQLASDFAKAQSKRDKLALACGSADHSSARNLYALAKGYDCVISTSTGYHMVLNRRCLTVSDKTKPATGSRW